MKTLFKLFIVLLVVVVGIAGAFFYVDTIAKKAIERGGEMALGVPTSLDEVNISFFGGEVSLNGLNIVNPAGFKAPTFMGLSQGKVVVSMGSLLGDTVVIPQVKLSGIEMNLEQIGKKNNIDPILARTRSLGGKEQQTAPQNVANKKGKKFIVESFLLEDVQVNASLDLLGQTSVVNLVLPKIELHNLGSKGQGLPLPELIQKVVQAILEAVQSSSGQLSPALAKWLAGELGGLDNIKAEVIGQAEAQVEKLVQELQQKLEKQVPADLPPEVNKVVDEKAGDLLKGLGGLLGGDKK